MESENYMKSILIEDLLNMKLEENTSSIEFPDSDGHQVKGWAIAKPINFEKDFLDDKTRKAMAKEVLDGHAIAVHFSKDEVDYGEIPVLYQRWLKSRPIPQPKE